MFEFDAKLSTAVVSDHTPPPPKPANKPLSDAWLLRKHVPGIKLRVINVVDLGVLMSPDVHPHGMDNISFEGLFTRSAPVIFAHHAYPAVIHSMMHGRANEARFHVRGFKDIGTTTTPFDMVVLNGMSRFDLAKLAMKYVPRLRSETADVADMFDLKLYEHRAYIRENFEDLPEIANWSWTPDFSDPTAPPPLAVGQPRAALFTDS